MIFLIYIITIFFMSLININVAINMNVNHNNNILYTDRENNINIKKYLGKWNIIYSNIQKINDNMDQCQNFYFYFDNNNQFIYRFEKIDENLNKNNKTGIIHIQNIDKSHLWKIKPTDNYSDEFHQEILYVDPEYKFSLISDIKKEKLYILARPYISNYDSSNLVIKHIIEKFNLQNTEFSEINHSECIIFENNY